MKKTILTLIAAIALSMGLYEANAQNVQLHYDMGRGCTTSTVEMFKADDGGSTFFFVDMDYNPKVSGAYWEIARELKEMASVDAGEKIFRTLVELMK